MSNPISRHFKQPAGIAAVTLCSGVLTAWCAALYATEPPDQRQLIWLFFPFTGLPCAGYLLWRLVWPFRGREAVPPSFCPMCGRTVATSPVRYVQLTGLVVIMHMRELPAFLCRRCSFRAFTRMTVHTLVLGWWGIASLFVTPGFVLSNLLFLARSQFAGGNRGHARRLLDERRDYTANLVASKDDATVVEVLVRDTGLPAEVVAEYVRGIRAAASSR